MKKNKKVEVKEEVVEKTAEQIELEDLEFVYNKLIELGITRTNQLEARIAELRLKVN